MYNYVEIFLKSKVVKLCRWIKMRHDHLHELITLVQIPNSNSLGVKTVNRFVSGGDRFRGFSIAVFTVIEQITQTLHYSIALVREFDLDRRTRKSDLHPVTDMSFLLFCPAHVIRKMS